MKDLEFKTAKIEEKLDGVNFVQSVTISKKEYDDLLDCKEALEKYRNTI